MQEKINNRPESWKIFPSGTIGQWENRPFINGFSAVEFKSLKQRLCFNNWGWVCTGSVQMLMALDDLTNVDLASLLRITEIRVSRGKLADYMTKLGHVRGFIRVKHTYLGDVWRREADLFPATLSWVSPEVQVVLQGLPAPEREVFEVHNLGSKSGRLIWARTAYEGYEAKLDGIPLPVDAYNKLLVSVEIPAAKRGQLELIYRPSGWRWTTPLAVIGLISAVIGSLLLRQSRLNEEKNIVRSM